MRIKVDKEESNFISRIIYSQKIEKPRFGKQWIISEIKTN